MHMHVGKEKYDYRNDRAMPGFYHRDTGKPLPHSIRSQLSKNQEWGRIMAKAERRVRNNGGLSTKFGGGKIIKGCISIVAALEGVKMLDDYVNAIQTGNTRQMDQVFFNFMTQLSSFGTIASSNIFADADKFHREMKLFALRNRIKK